MPALTKQRHQRVRGRTIHGGWLSPSVARDSVFQRRKSINHLFNISTFSEYTVVNKTNLMKIDPKAHLDKVFLLGCGVSTGHGAVKKVANVQPGSTVAVFGLGTVGLAAVQAAASSGASRVIGVDINPKKFSLAKEFGATDTVKPEGIPEANSTGYKRLDRRRRCIIQF